MSINWRSIKKVGMPTNEKVGYLVFDGKDIEYSDLYIEYSSDGTWNKEKSDFNYSPKKAIWTGGSVYALYEEVSGTEFDFSPTHWCPVSELNLPVED